LKNRGTGSERKGILPEGVFSQAKERFKGKREGMEGEMNGTGDHARRAWAWGSKWSSQK